MKLKSLLAVASLACASWGHFGVVIPSNSTIDEPSQAKEIITYKFTHPFEGMMMNLDKPIEAGVFVGGKKRDNLKFKRKKRWQNELLRSTIQYQRAWNLSILYGSKTIF